MKIGSLLLVTSALAALSAHAEDPQTPLLILEFKHAAEDANTARVINEGPPPPKMASTRSPPAPT